MILSVCPPHAALDVARATEGFAGTYVDANAISPMRAAEIAALQPRFVDGGIIGPPPRAAGETRLYLSGAGAEEVGDALRGVDRRRACRARRIRPQDGVRRLVEGHGRAAARGA